jgi:hypothetical protein
MNYLRNSAEFPTRLSLFVIFSPTLRNHTRTRCASLSETANQ